MDVIPKDLIQFLNSNIESVDQLEILRILASDAGKDWSVAELAKEVHLRPEAVDLQVRALEARGLLTIKQKQPLMCRHGSSKLAESVTRLLQAYRERPVTMIKIVYERAKNPLKSFTDAFRLKQED